MHARAALVAVSFCLVTAACSASPARAGAWTLAPGEYYSEMLGSWSSTDFYHNQNGKKRDLAGGGLWEERSLLSYTEFGWKKRLSFIFGIPAVSVTRRFGAPAGNRSIPTTTGLGDATVGFRWKLANGRTAAALELDWKPPLGYERSRFLSHADSVAAGDSNGDGDSLDVDRARQLGTPVLGDGQQDVSLTLHLGTALGQRGFLQIAGGYKYRFEDPADQILAGADLGIWLSKGLLLGGSYRGVIASAPVKGNVPLLGFSGVDVPLSDPTFHRAGPTLLYRVDDRMDLFLSTMHTMSATNALHTDEVFVGVAFRQTKLNRLQGFLGNRTNP